MKVKTGAQRSSETSKWSQESNKWVRVWTFPPFKDLKRWAQLYEIKWGYWGGCTTISWSACFVLAHASHLYHSALSCLRRLNILWQYYNWYFLCTFSSHVCLLLDTKSHFKLKWMTAPKNKAWNQSTIYKKRAQHKIFGCTEWSPKE